MPRYVLLLVLACAFAVRGPSAHAAPGTAEPTAVEPTAAEPTEPAGPPTEPAEPGAAVAGEGAPTEAAAAEEAPALPDEATAQSQMLAGLSMSDEERAAYAVELRKVVAQVRGKVLGKISEKLQRGQTEKLDRVAIGLGLFASCGVFLLLAPVVLRRRYPNKTGTLFKYGALASVLFVGAVGMFASVLFVMRGAQGALGEHTNPQVQIVQATFDLFQNKAEDLALVGPMLVEPTLASLTGESDQPVVTQMLANVQKIKNDFEVFSSVGRFFQRVDWLFGVLPLVLVLLALFLFAKVARPTLAEIVALPGRAASGERGLVKQVVGLTLRNVWAEAKAAFATIGVLVALTLATGALLGFVLQPALEIFIAYLTLSLMYVVVSPAASSGWVFVSLAGSIVFLVLNLAVAILASAFFLGKTQQIFQAKFRTKTPLRTHARFWKWGSISALWTLALPVLYITVAEKAIGWLVEKSMEKYLNTEDIGASNWPFLLATGPILFIVLFVVVFWLARGLRAMKLLATYKVTAAAAPAAAPVIVADANVPALPALVQYPEYAIGRADRNPLDDLQTRPFTREDAARIEGQRE